MAERCAFTADMIAPNGKGLIRIPNVRCAGDMGHERGDGDREHEFIAGSNHTFGVSFESGRYVTRR